MKEQPEFAIESIGGTIEEYQSGYRFFIPSDLVDPQTTEATFTDGVVYDSEFLAVQGAFAAVQGNTNELIHAH